MQEGEVSIAALAFLEEAAPRFGVSVERLLAGLPISVADLRRLDKRIRWDDVAEVCERLEAAIGPAKVHEAGRLAVHSEIFGGARRIAGLFVHSRQLFRAAFVWVGPSMYRNLVLHFVPRDDRTFELTLEMPAPYKPSTAWFNLAAGALEGIPAILGLPPAHVVADISLRRAHFVVTTPDAKPRRRGIARLLFSAASVIDELGRQEEELRASREARRRALEVLHERERAYSSLLANLSAMGYRSSPDASAMELVTEGCKPITGYEPDELVGADAIAFGDLVVEDDRSARRLKRRASLLARRTCASEYRIRTKSGEVRWVLDVANGNYDEEGGLVAVEGIIVDITERRRLEERVAHVHRLEAIGQLSGSVAHDFNNLLAAILGATENALAGLPADHPARADVADAHAAASKGADLTRQLLTFARRRMIEPRVVDLGNLVQGVFGILAHVVGPRIKLEARIGSGLWPVIADAGQLEQVIVNLAANARDAMPGGGELTITALNAESAGLPPDVPHGEYVVLRVEDTGAGMSAEVLSRVFEPFFTTKAPGQGTGLGLASSYAAIAQAGGFISPSSEPGRGTRFDVYLPRATVTASATGASANGNAVVPSRANES